MEESSARILIYAIAAAGGACVVALLSWGPVARRLERFRPDPEKGFKIAAIAGIALFAAVGVLMSIGIMLRLLKVI